jgi:hypothetical protein
VTDWQVVWLGVIAIAVALMALIQIVVLVAIARLAMQAVAGVKDLRREIRPLIDKVHKIADDASRVSGQAVRQVERLDGLIASTAVRIEDTVEAIQNVVLGPLRKGSAAVAVLRAVLGAFRGRGERRRHAHDDEDPLFVG